MQRSDRRSAEGQGGADYTATTKFLHWLVALLLVVLLALGPFAKRAVGLTLTDRLSIYQLHKSLGLLVVVLMLVRLFWRMTHQLPRLPSTMPTIERGTARAVHALLYALLLIMPLTGWLLVSSATLPVPTHFFGLWQMPHWPWLAELPATARKPYEALFKEAHFWCAIAIGALVVLHSAAAIRHQLVHRDGVLARILPRGLLMSSSAALILSLVMGWLTPCASDEAAPRWRVDPAKSRLSFQASAGGQAVNGTFKDFTAEIRLDPASPEALDIKVRINVGSLATGTGEVDAALHDQLWFDTARHNEASFVATKARRLADGRIELLGELTIRGTSKSVELPFKLMVEGKHAKAEGEIMISRKVFGVGPQAPVIGLVVSDVVKVLVLIEAESDD